MKKLDLLFCLVIVCILFIPTLTRTWLIYDERIISEGIYFPMPTSLGEIFEIIQNFGLNFNVLSSNTIYSSNYITRTAPLGQILGMMLTFFFKHNPFNWHVFNLILHLINTCLLYAILKIFLDKRLIVVLLTTLWGIHPVMIEPVLLSTNVGALFSYIFFFAFLLDFLLHRERNKSLLRNILIPALFLIPMLTNEYIVTMPFVIFIFALYINYQKYNLKEALKTSLIQTKPYLTGFLIYTVYFFLVSHHKVSHPLYENHFLIAVQRIFWLSPQIFFHFIKLVIFPRILSIDQTIFVKVGKTIWDPYAIFCQIFLLSWLFIPLSLFLFKKKCQNLFLLSFAFFFALLPFLHILMPSYTLACERYLYCPLAMLIIGVSKIIASRATVKVVPTVLVVILILCFVRSYYRATDWKDNYSFINSTYKTSTDPLFKAMRLGMLGKTTSILKPEEKEKTKKYFVKTLKLLKEARKQILKEKIKYQKHLPLVIKSYGLDYDSLLTKAAFLEASSRCLELNEDYKIGLKILEPYIKNIKKTDPHILELYVHFLNLDKRFDKAEKVLLKTNSLFPGTPFILNKLIEFELTYKNNKKEAEKYLQTALKSNPYDTGILLKALSFYQGLGQTSLTAKYSYLYGLRTGSRTGYKQALSLYLTSGNLKAALRVVNKLYKIAPYDPEALFFVSKYYYLTKNPPKALSILTEAYILTKQKDTDPALAFDIVITLAKLYLRLGQVEKAAAFSQDILNLAKGDPEALAKAQQFFNLLKQSLGK